MDQEYIVRRLTPTECARLQGFPDWWGKLDPVENPSEELIAEWIEIFETFAAATDGKPKTRNQVIKFLRSPHSDTSEYKMWGNGVALPCVQYVLEGIVEVTNETKG